MCSNAHLFTARKRSLLVNKDPSLKTSYSVLKELIPLFSFILVVFLLNFILVYSVDADCV